MKQIPTAILLSVFFFLSSCFSLKTFPLQGSYSDGNFEGYSEKSKDVVWDNIIDFFAKSGISIRIIDKSSGLITSGETAIPWTRENSKGELIKKEAWVVIQKVVDSRTRKPVPYYSVTAEWNVRIKESNGKTLINVNLVNPTYLTLEVGGSRSLFKKGSFQSTGVFEKMIYDLVK